jgi:hypothetical protein
MARKSAKLNMAADQKENKDNTAQPPMLEKPDRRKSAKP